ncbi:MAG: DUF5076 domain-containing protein [Alphaproteobacteria bacterium]
MNEMVNEELPVPSQVVAAKQKMELARIWIADGLQVVTLSNQLWKDPAAWGLMLVDLARHVAVAYEGLGVDREVALDRIRAALDAEWSQPTE